MRIQTQYLDVLIIYKTCIGTIFLYEYLIKIRISVDITLFTVYCLSKMAHFFRTTFSC